ncbi:MAG: DUF4743 domain-containing protein [Burkholderiales bacterium]
MLNTKIPDRLARAARAFDAARHVAFRIGERPVGWVRRDWLSHLEPWQRWFIRDDHTLALAAALSTLNARTAFLAEVAEGLARIGVVNGWRDERYAIVEAWGQPVLSHIERAAARFFGVTTFAAHANGVTRGKGGPRMWIARRSPTKPIDPGLLDNLVGGGMSAEADPLETLVREAGEEAGIPPALASTAVARGTIDILREVPEGVQQETLFAFDLELPADFVPHNQDGEVAEVQLMALDDVARVIAARGMTLDASLVAAGYLERTD